MIELTDSARERLDDYVRRLRAALRGTRSIEPDEVEQSVREHVEIALHGTPAPVGAEPLAEVLERLGPPERWLAEDERPVWRQMMERLRKGPEDWRLAYASFGLFVLSLLLLPAGIGVLLFPAAFLLSRAYVEFLETRGERLGARRWLVYPPIAIVMMGVLTVLLVAPVAAFLAWGIGDHALHRMFLQPHWIAGDHFRFDTGVAAMAFGVWWIVASLLLAAFARPIRFPFKPLLDNFQRRHAYVLTAIGFIVAAAGALTLFL